MVNSRGGKSGQGALLLRVVGEGCDDLLEREETEEDDRVSKWSDVGTPQNERMKVVMPYREEEEKTEHTFC